MKNKPLLLCLLTILLSMMLIVSVAQENDPRINDDANACFPGGSFAGMCDKVDVDDDGDTDIFDRDWCWNCGWYMIRVQFGIYSPDVLDGICRKVPPVIVEEVEKVKKEKKDKTDDPEPTETPDFPDTSGPT